MTSDDTSKGTTASPDSKTSVKETMEHTMDMRQAAERRRRGQ